MKLSRTPEEEVERLEMLVPNKGFCPAPFVHTWINANNGGFKLCCMSKIIKRWDPTKDLQSQFQEYWSSKEMQEIRKDFLNGKYPSVCDFYCGKYEREKLHHQNDRLNFIQKYHNDLVSKGDLESLNDLEFYVVKGNKHGKPLDIDLRPSNLCNLKCRSCNTVWSTEIQKEVLANPEIQGWSHWDTISFSTQKWKKRTTDEWEDHTLGITKNLDFSNVFRLKLTGGESFIDPRVAEILSNIVENGHAKNIHFHTITNCTSIPTKIYNSLKQFKSVSFSFSFDGYKQVDEFLREGTIWDKKIKVLDKILTLPNIKWSQFMHVVQPVSVFHLIDHVGFFLLMIRTNESIRGVDFNPIVDPKFLHVGWLDDDHKEHILSLIDQCKEVYNMTNSEMWWFDTLKSELNTDFKDKRIIHCNDFVRHQLALDKIRNTHTLSITPQLQRYFDRYDSNNVSKTTHDSVTSQYVEEKNE